MIFENRAEKPRAKQSGERMQNWSIPAKVFTGSVAAILVGVIGFNAFGPPLRACFGVLWLVGAICLPISAVVWIVHYNRNKAPREVVVVNSKSAEIKADLEQLRELRDSGAITEADFEAKKAELLGRI